VDQGYNSEEAKQDAKIAGIALMIIKLPEVKMGLSFYPDGGSSNVVLYGQRVFVV
jgi:hypothetical protein